MLRRTSAQKAYEAACDAVRAWAAAAPAEVLRSAESGRIAGSYGIRPADASSIIAKACRERRV